MNFGFAPEDEAFRTEVKTFLQEKIPQDWSPRGFIFISEDEWAMARRFDMEVSRKGWLIASWPTEYGGMGLGPMRQLIMDEEFALAGAPDGGARGHGPHFVGPVIARFGNDMQRQKYIPGISDGSEIWAQCFSEDSAGSDMANILTTARRDGDEYVINGTKIWTGQGHRADYAILTARTGDAPKHRSISLFIVDLHAEGVRVDPIWTMPQHGRLNAEVFDDVRVPAEARIGPENEAWPMMMEVMNHERSNIASSAHARRLLGSLIQLGKEAAPGSHIAQTRSTWMSEAANLAIQIEICRLMNYRIAWLSSKGEHVSYEASIVKMLGGQTWQQVANLVMKALGPHSLLAGDRQVVGAHNDWLADYYLQSVMATIVSGSSEIMRNVIATRGLGLPR